MTFDELFQYYANMGITSRPEGIQTVTPVQTIQEPIIPIQQIYQNDNDNNQTMINTYDPNMGKGFYDYEAAAYGIGSTFPGTIARIATGLMSLPTPFNIARQAAEKYFSERAAEQAAQQKAFEEMATAKRDIQQYTGGGGEGPSQTPSAPQRDYSTHRAYGL